MATAADEGLRDGPGLLQSMRRYPRLVGLIVLSLAALAAVLAYMQPEQYSATAQLYLADPRTQSVLSTAGRVAAPDEYVPQQADRVKARAVLDQAASELGVTTRSLGNRISVQGIPDLNLITITATAETAADASAAANTVASAYMTFSEERIVSTAEQTIAALRENITELNAEIELLESEVTADPEDALAQSRLDVKLAQLNEYEARVTDVTVQATAYGSGVDLFERAETPRNPATTSPALFAVLGGLIGLILGGSIAYWRAGRTTAVQSAQEPAHLLGAPLLGEVPIFKDLHTGSTDASVMDHYGFLLASLDFELRTIQGRTVLVTSADEGEGKTTTALQLALAATAAGRRTVLVDGDLRRASLSERLGLGQAPGLTEMGSGHQELADCIHAIAFHGEHLSVLPSGAGSGESSRVLRSRQFADSLQALRADAELVVIDSAPLLAVPDTSVLAGHLDGVVVVIREGRATVPDLTQLRERLNFISAPLIGYVWVTQRPSTTGRYEYGYGRTEEPTTRGTPAPTPSPTLSPSTWAQTWGSGGDVPREPRP